MPTLTEGQRIIQEYQDLGFSDAEIATMKETRSQAFVAKGGKSADLAAFWGEDTGEGKKLFTKLAENNLKAAKWSLDQLPVAEGFADTLAASFGMSTTGLAYESLGGRPTKQTKAPEAMSWGESAGAALGSLGDIPAMVAGLGGTLLATKNPWAAGAASMAFPEAMRQGYLYAYTKGEHASTSDVLYGATQAPVQVAKAAIVGAVAGKTGAMAYDAVAKVAGPKLASLAANISGTVSSTGAGAALNGQMPSLKDFTVATVLMAMLPGSHYSLTGHVFKKVGARARTEFTAAGERLKSNMQNIWAKTGVKPLEQFRIAETDKIARQATLGPDADSVLDVSPWTVHRKPEPEPYKSKVVEEGKPEIIGAAKGSEDGLVDQFTPAGKINPETGIAPVKSVSPEQLAAITEIEAPLTPEQAANLKEAAAKYRNDDGSIDLEAVLIDHAEGSAAADLYRANGRDYNHLNSRTQRFLEYVGSQIDRDGYAPVPKEGAGGGSGKGPPALPPEGGTGLAGTPKPGEEHFPRDYEFVSDDINANVAKSTGDSPNDFWRNWKAGWREFAPMAELDKMLNLGRKYGDIGIETFARLQKSAEDRFMFRVGKGGGGYTVTNDKFGNPQYKANYKVPTFHSIINSARKSKYGTDGWRAYMMALDTLDRIKLGKKTTTTLEQAQEAIGSIPAAERKVYEQLSKDFQAMMNDSLEGVRQHGGISEEAIAKFQEDHPNYFPAQVFLDAKAGMPRKGLGRLFRKAKGHKLMLKDAINSTLEMLRKREVFNNANLVRVKTVHELKKHFESPSKAVAVVAPKAKDTMTLMDENGSVISAPDEVKFFAYNPHEIIYYEGGVQYVYKVPDFPGREVFMKSLLSDGANAFERAVAIRGMALISRTTRELIVNNLGYVYRMVVRDSYQHAVLSKYGGVVGVNLVKGAFDMAGHAIGNQHAKIKVDEALLNGAWVGGIQRMDTDALLTSLHDLEHTGTIGAMLNVARNPLEFLHKVTRVMDATVRIGGTYSGAVKAFGPIPAADMARVLGGDFAERSNSSMMNAVASMTPFYTGWQRAGIDSLNKAIHQDPFGIGLRGVMNVTIPTIAMAAITYMLEDAYDVPEVNRVRSKDRKVMDNFMFVPIIHNGDLATFPIPLPYGIGSLFASPVHRMMDYMIEDDPRAAKEWFYNVAMSFVDGAVPLVDNPVVSSYLEGTSGFDYGFTTPIIPERFEHMSGYNAYQPWTSETAKAISRWVGEPGLDVADVTAVMIEHQINTFTGSTGRDLLRIIDLAAKDNKPVSDWANTPFIGSFFSRHPGLNARPITDFYDELAKFRNAQGDVQIAKKRRDIPALLKAKRAEALMVKLDKGAEALANMRGVSYAIMENKKMSPDDKRQAIDNIATMMIMVSKFNLKMLDGFRRARDGS